jgi:hypothetical protein
MRHYPVYPYVLWLADETVPNCFFLVLCPTNEALSKWFPRMLCLSSEAPSNFLGGLLCLHVGCSPVIPIVCCGDPSCSLGTTDICWLRSQHLKQRRMCQINSHRRVICVDIVIDMQRKSACKFCTHWKNSCVVSFHDYEWWWYNYFYAYSLVWELRRLPYIVLHPYIVLIRASYC